MQFRVPILYKLILILFAGLSFPGFAAVSVSDDDNTLMDFGGSIDPVCKVRNNLKNRSLNIDLTSATRQKTNHVYIWCNTGQSSAQATYESLNGGNLVNENGHLIPYLIQIPQTVNDVSLATPQTVSQRSGTGVNGDDQRRNIRVIPQVTGFEYAGTYQDTIQVTVSYN